MPARRKTFFGRMLTGQYPLPEELPFKAELFSADQMERYGSTLATQHILTPTPSHDLLLRRLAENENILITASQVLTATATASRRLTPAGEWLLDNFYLIDEQIRTAKRHLPLGYSRELPCLLSGVSAGLPRVYDLALETIAHGDGRIGSESLRRFVAAYQTVAPLKLGELWAIPIMLRLALIENLRRLAATTMASRADQDLADAWAQRMIDSADQDPKSLVLVIADMARSNPPMTTAFIAEFTRRLQGQSAALSLPLTWIKQLLAESQLTIEQLIQVENQQQAADQVSIGNSISSLRFLSAMDWREFVEAMSVVEQTLREDTNGIYAAMDFATRDRYRHVVEKLAKRTRQTEGQIAQFAVQLAQAGAVNHGYDDRRAHVGFYLIGQGFAQLQQLAETHYTLHRTFGAAFLQAIPRLLTPFPLTVFIGAIGLLTLLFTGGLLFQAHHEGIPAWGMVLLGILLLLATSHLAVALVNWLTTLFIKPQILPRLDFSTGIPSPYRTLVIVPTMLTSGRSIEGLIEALEVRFLANRDASLHFGLLTDFLDAPTETLPNDQLLLEQLKTEIERLNAKYAPLEHNVFFLFHRPRRWNAQEQAWMGYERKRGKLAALNQLLLSGVTNDFALIVGNTTLLNQVKYVITLDTDTQLPRDAARQLVGVIAHPLNRAIYDPAQQRVVAGYSILQPRISVSLSGTNLSRYARLHGGESGIDPYTRAVSDVYQDVFQEGSFIGKGIYDLEAFEQVLTERLPENQILSHDLLEGCYARAGLVSDMQLYEEYPPHYRADVSRRHRWIRGDWQLAGWLLPQVNGLNEQRRPNPLTALSRWKIFDNLRRSLTAVVLTTLLLAAWTVLPSAGFWTLTVVALLVTPSLSASLLSLVRKPVDLLLGQHLMAESRTVSGHFTQAALTLICLPYEAYFSVDAIVRTVWRMQVSHCRLLEWNPSSETSRDKTNSLAATYRTMWFAPSLALLTASYLALFRSDVGWIAAPILLLWVLAPALVWWISQPLAYREASLSITQTDFLRRTARRTWSYFATFVRAEDHWLPPDNYQVYQGVGVAHRTSPTNIGLGLLANLAAYDFGYIPLGVFMERCTATLATMSLLERFHGHFYNWYDTQTLQPLYPLYVSTVDSGNLAGHLLTLHPALIALPEQPVLAVRWLEGLEDTFKVWLESTKGITPPHLLPLQTALQAAQTTRPVTVATVKLCLTHCLTLAKTALVEDADTWALAFTEQCELHLADLNRLIPAELDAEFAGIPSLRDLSRFPTPSAQQSLTALDALAQQVHALADVQYDFLFDKPRRLLAIGYNVSERQRDHSYYDLLASEARLCTFVAIAQEQVPQESWFALGRLLITTEGEPTLLSWSGSMFEYLMPLLVMPTYSNTLIDQTYRAVVQRQIDYGNQNKVPWGISESGYNTVDIHLNYQYRAFGVPGLGLKRGLAEDLVIAPYASALALMVAPDAACSNLQRLADEGMVGQFGFYEAVDYTPSRQRRNESHVVIQSFMAHHQGMSLLAFAYVLLNRPMQQRFTANPILQSTLLLLQERLPKASAYYTQTSEAAEILLAVSEPQTPIPVRVLNHTNTPLPEVQLLSNGRYHLMVTNAGGGYSRHHDLAVTRWREDTTCDSWGTFCYIRDVASGAFWSTAHQPTLVSAEHYEAIFSEGRAEFRRLDHEFETHIDIVVSPEDDIELRRIRITNNASTRRTLDVTSYAEVVLAPPAADALHPAFSNLFVQTEIIQPLQAILCTRRPRALQEKSSWLFHLLAVHEGESEAISYETDRAQFIGRGNTLVAPHALTTCTDLSGSEGAVLDPIIAIRHRITLEPEASITLDLVIGVADTRAASLELVEKYRDRRLADRVFDLAWTHSQVVLRQLNASEAEAQSYGRLANSVIYSHAFLRADASIISSNHRGQSALWAHAISGDLPIVLLQIHNLENIEMVRQLVKAHAYWRLKGLAVDLMIWNEDRDGYRQSLQEQIMGLITWVTETQVLDHPGSIFVRHADQISSEDRILIQSVARVILNDSQGTLAEQINRRSSRVVRVPRLKTSRYPVSEMFSTLPPRPDLILFNGLGGFTRDGREYVITPPAGTTTPAPWVNVLANPSFGTIISESGQAYTWSENAHEFRLTPWHNDPVSDSSGEALYIRDEESGHFWSPTPLPCAGTGAYISRHGFGYSVFEHREGDIHTELIVFVALDAAVKCSILKIHNAAPHKRHLSVTGYVEWVLGDLRPKSTPYIITEFTTDSGVLLARNSYNLEFAERIAFFDVSDPNCTVTSDRGEFIGRNGTLQNPLAMQQAFLSGRVGAALDPCAAIQVPLTLAAGETRELVFSLGVGRDLSDTNALVQRFRSVEAARHALTVVQEHWVHTLDAIQVTTPDHSINVLANGWLLYQTLACRMWGRSGYYQSGGAFGFRDQLQDTMALVHTVPQQVREHLLLCANHQFAEGDVQHWWHPPSNRGVRTRCSDDYLWLPLVTCRYLTATHDFSILDEPAAFLSGRVVNAGEDSYYDLPTTSSETANLYQHCVRAILYGLHFGEHGLPLMGSGDWNDGMNLVGIEGKGESVWLGFFLSEVLTQFAEVANTRGDRTFAEHCQSASYQLHQNLERHGWDGAWYRRAYFDDGTPLGSASNPECQIDSIAQSWAVLSGVASPERAAQAMQSLNTHLVKRDAALIQLLDPPFNSSTLNPGYIRGYVPGVRENGGQYTHAAIWAAMAFAHLGDHAHAWEIMTLINPVNHGKSPAGIATYKVEPYVVAADVYGVAPHIGRGGWTWYTGSAGWMYRLITESLLGLRREGNSLYFEPCLPDDWTEVKLKYRYRETVYQIVINQQLSDLPITHISFDGVEQVTGSIALVNDQHEHQIYVTVIRSQ